MLYIGVDLGTSAVKLLVMDETGDIKKIVSKEYPLFFPHPGWSEQKPEDWFEKSMEGIKELTAECDKSQVAGISFGGQMHGLVALDKDDKVIRPAILWNDGRTGEETEYLNEVIGKEKLSEYTANIAFAGFTAPKILWMKKHEPENFAKITKIMLPKDYLAYKLSGSFCTDVSDASGMLLMDVKNRCWSKEMMDICGITEDKLPKLYESFEVVGTLKKEVADELGFSENVKVIAGAGDNAAAAVGTGTVGDGMCNISLGTSGTIFISSNKFGVDENNALHSFAHAFVSSGNMPRRIREYCKQTGQTVPETPGEIVCCINQSLAMKYRRELDKIQYCLNKKYDTIHMIGGGIQSKLLCQMTANATGCRVAAGPVEATAFGNIAVQMIALGQIKDIKEAREIIERSEATCYYEPQNTEEWSQAYARYCQVTKRQEEELE